ncbi:MAG: hypothetical protein U0W24_03810 [Bacteroidales bacterium]
MKLPVNVILFFCLLLGLLSCNNQQDMNKTPIARVYDKFLYKEDLAGVVQSGLSAEDSINKVKSFIDFWVKRQAMTKTAELNLAEEQKDVTKELEDYRMDLLIFRYKQKFIEQNLDTIVTEKQINTFYTEHEAEFKLVQPAVKATFIKILKTTPNISMVKSLYRSAREKDIDMVFKYCKENSAEYKNFKNEWIYFKDVIIEIPFRVDDQEAFLKTNSFIEVEDSLYSYLLNITNYRLKDAVAPLVFVEGNIQGILLNQRKQSLIDDLETNIYYNMLDKKDIELFNEKNKK